MAVRNRKLINCADLAEMREVDQDTKPQGLRVIVNGGSIGVRVEMRPGSRELKVRVVMILTKYRSLFHEKSKQ